MKARVICAYGGSCWPARSAWWWGRLLYICCCSVLLTAAPPSYSSEQSRLIESLRTRLQTISAAAQSLEAESRSWKQVSAENEQRAVALLSELATLRSELESWQTASEDSRRQAAELRASLEKSEEKLKVVSQILRNSADFWKAAAEEATRSARRARRGGVMVSILAAMVGGAIGYLIGK